MDHGKRPLHWPDGRLWLRNRKDLKNGILLGPDNCQLNSKVDSDTGKILFTGFTNSSGIQEVLKIISHSSGFRPISMDKAGVDCIANETLFVHSTLPNSISRCPIRDTVIMLCNPQEIIRNSDKNLIITFSRQISINICIWIRREYLNAVSPSLQQINKSWHSFADKYVNLWREYVREWIDRAKVSF